MRRSRQFSALLEADAEWFGVSFTREYGLVTKRRTNSAWPRLMKAADAAAYVGTSESNFRRLVDSGAIRQPLERGGERLWDIRDLDEHADSLPRCGGPLTNEWAGQSL